MGWGQLGRSQLQEAPNARATAAVGPSSHAGADQQATHGHGLLSAPLGGGTTVSEATLSFSTETWPLGKAAHLAPGAKSSEPGQGLPMPGQAPDMALKSGDGPLRPSGEAWGRPC